MPIRRTHSGDGLTSTMHLKTRGAQSAADVAEFRAVTDTWGLEARLHSIEQSARTVLERAGHGTDIPRLRLWSLARGGGDEPAAAALVLWRLKVLREAMAGGDPREVALAAMDVQELFDEARWTEAHGADAASGRSFREAGGARKKRGHPNRALHLQWLAEVDQLIAAGAGPWQAAVKVAAHHERSAKTIHDAVRRLRKKVPS